MKIAWITDTHLEFIRPDRQDQFFHELAMSGANAIIHTGDISNANHFDAHLRRMARAARLPIYFVLGNHDYYHSNVKEVRKAAKDLMDEHGPLDDLGGDILYLTECPCYITPAPDTFIIGVDGWADARNGDFMSGKVWLNDSNFIEDLKYAAHFGRREGLGEKMCELSDIDTRKLEAQIEDLFDPDNEFAPKHIIIATHVPPFTEAALYQGKPSGPDFSPFFTNQGMGNMLLMQATYHPECKFTVLCGHSHHKARLEKLPNLEVRTGHAEYHYPQIEEILEF